MKKTYTIDAAGKRLGRIATQATIYLTGKNNTDYARNTYPDVEVKIVNASKIAVAEKKKVQKNYKTFSGWPSGLKNESLERLAARKGFAAVLENAIYGMVPSNRLRAQIMKNLTITE